MSQYEQVEKHNASSKKREGNDGFAGENMEMDARGKL